jgi:hypothetical protein
MTATQSTANEGRGWLSIDIQAEDCQSNENRTCGLRAADDERYGRKVLEGGTRSGPMLARAYANG